MKGKRIIKPVELLQQAIDWLQSNHMGIENTMLLTKESINLMNMNMDIENTVKIPQNSLAFSRCC